MYFEMTLMELDSWTSSIIAPNELDTIKKVSLILIFLSKGHELLRSPLSRLSVSCCFDRWQTQSLKQHENWKIIPIGSWILLKHTEGWDLRRGRLYLFPCLSVYSITSSRPNSISARIRYRLSYLLPFWHKMFKGFFFRYVSHEKLRLQPW